MLPRNEMKNVVPQSVVSLPVLFDIAMQKPSIKKARTKDESSNTDGCCTSVSLKVIISSL